jgi:phenylpyruvate tautomerase PptA (4-oxalocrotonate tautomerase family)
VWDIKKGINGDINVVGKRELWMADTMVMMKQYKTVKRYVSVCVEDVDMESVRKSARCR